MTLAFVIIYWLASILLWVSILALTRSLQVKKDMSQILSSALSVIFLVLVLRITLLNPWCYIACSLIYSLFMWSSFPSPHTGWKKIMTYLIDIFFWPQSLCLNMFMYSVKEDAENP